MQEAAALHAPMAEEKRERAPPAEAPVAQGLDADPQSALAAYAMPGAAETFADRGFDAYLAKPFANEELMETLRRVAG